MWRWGKRREDIHPISHQNGKKRAELRANRTLPRELRLDTFHIALEAMAVNEEANVMEFFP